jgi:hypothetical protein
MSIARRNLRLVIPKTTIQNVIHKRLWLYAYKTQLKHAIKLDDRHKRYDFLRQICFSDEAAFHMNGCVNRHRCRIRGKQTSLASQHQLTERIRNLRSFSAFYNWNHLDVFNSFWVIVFYNPDILFRWPCMCFDKGLSLKIVLCFCLALRHIHFYDSAINKYKDKRIENVEKTNVSFNTCHYFTGVMIAMEKVG